MWSFSIRVISLQDCGFSVSFDIPGECGAHHHQQMLRQLEVRMPIGQLGPGRPAVETHAEPFVEVVTLLVGIEAERPGGLQHRNRTFAALYGATITISGARQLG